MLIESEYLKMQIRDMAEVVEKNDPGKPFASHYAYNMVRSTLDSILASIYAIERYTKGRADNGGP